MLRLSGEWCGRLVYFKIGTALEEFTIYRRKNQPHEMVKATLARIKEQEGRNRDPAWI